MRAEKTRLYIERPSAGASLEVRRTEPSIDLATLAGCLADAVPLPTHPDQVLPRQRQPLITWRAADEGGVLTIDTRAVISRLTTSRLFQRLKPGPDRGFLRDAPVPRRRTTAHLGGRIVEGTGGRLRDAVDRLVNAVDAELANIEASGVSFASLASGAPGDVLHAIGNRIGCNLADGLQGKTRLNRTSLEPVGLTQDGRRAEVARTITAVEEIVGDRSDQFEHTAAAVRDLLRSEDYPERQIATALATYHQQLEAPESQVARFFDFLEDEALGRVRLHVTYRLMDAIAAAAATRLDTVDGNDMRVLIAYVQRANALFTALGRAGDQDVYLNLAAEYGNQADFSLTEEIGLVGFSGCLPVWPEWVAQIFEQQRRAERDPALRSTVREVSYRFRINGIVPGGRESAYATRLGRIREALFSQGAPHRVRRSLAELVFLAAVIPGKQPEVEADRSAADALQVAQETTRHFQSRGREAIGDTLMALEDRSAQVDRITRALVTVLRTRGAAATGGLAGLTCEFFVNVGRQLFDLDRIAHSLNRPLATNEAPSKELIAFYRSISITPDRGLPTSLFSVPVRIRLGERSLMSVGQTATGSVARALPRGLLQVVWRPYTTTLVDGEASTAAVGPTAENWQAPAYVELQYDLATIGRNPDPSSKPRDPEQTEHLLAAFRAAFAMLTYVALQRVLRRVSRGKGLAERGALCVSMLRLHADRVAPDPFSGPTALFAASQAVETALARDFDLRMQGLVLDESANSDKDRGVFHALLAALPLVIERRTTKDDSRVMEPTLGLITLGSRPCTSVPDVPEQHGDTLFTVRTYRAQSVTEPVTGYRIWCDSVRTEIRETRVGETMPPSVVEEIGRLYELGYRHVLLLAHRYGGRRIGGSVRYTLHDHANTLAALSTSYPDLFVYPVVRDTFPATRMRGRELQYEDGFEILAPDEHLAANVPGAELRHDYTPFYSLATMHVIGEAFKPQSGVCTYFLLRAGQGGSIEQAERLRANLLLTDGTISGLRGDLIALLRGLHYLEAERPPTRDRYFQPVLDPYTWLSPESHGHAGEVVVRTSRRRAGTVVLSLPAVLEHVSRAMRANAEPPNRVHA